VFLALVAVLHADGGRVEVDGPLLYMQARSLVIDHDLDYTNEFAEFVPPQLQFIAEEARARGCSPDAWLSHWRFCGCRSSSSPTG
jgi:hypothetical protein